MALFIATPKLSWTKTFFKKWLDVKGKFEDFQAHSNVGGGMPSLLELGIRPAKKILLQLLLFCVASGGDNEWRSSCAEREAFKVNKTIAGNNY